MNIQERLMNAYLNEQQQLRALEQQQSSAMGGSIGIAKREPERIVPSAVGIKREEVINYDCSENIFNQNTNEYILSKSDHLSENKFIQF